MPNWCDNSITISGPTETIKKLWETATSMQGSDERRGLLEAMVPIGEWEYGSAVENWGTKWDIDHEGLEFTDNGDGTGDISGWFNSAWSPPVSAYDNFLENNEDCGIYASYYEPGMDFAGFYTNGEDEYIEGLTSQCELPEDDRSELFNRLDEEFALMENYEMNQEDEDE
jgi:hypothetical protein